MIIFMEFVGALFLLDLDNLRTFNNLTRDYRLNSGDPVAYLNSLLFYGKIKLKMYAFPAFADYKKGVDLQVYTCC